MTWFVTDDSFHSHPKVIGLSFAAIGVWNRCGSWCCEHLTDGKVPPKLARAWGIPPEAIEELLTSGLWEPGEDGGWVFHDWADYQQSKIQVLAKRDAAKNRMQHVRANKKRTPREPKKNRARSSPYPSPSPSPILKEERENARSLEEPGFKPPDHSPCLRLGKHYQELYDAEQEGSRKPRPYDEQRIGSTDFKQFTKLAELVKAEAARSGIGARRVFEAAAQAFLRDPKQREKGLVLEFFVRDFAHYCDRSGLEEAS